MIRNSKEILDDKSLQGYSINDIDIDTLEEYRRRLDKQNPSNIYKNKNDNELLISLGAMTKNRETGKEELNLGGLLFFGKYSSIREQLPHRSEEHTSELQSRGHLVCRLLLEKK